MLKSNSDGTKPSAEGGLDDPLRFLLQTKGNAMLFAQILTPEQNEEAWKVFLNLGVIGVVLFVGLMFSILIGYILFVALKRFLLKQIPDLVQESILTLQSVRKSQEGILTTQKQQADNTAKIIDLHSVGARRDEGMLSMLQKGLDPIGWEFRNHIFSVKRVEEFLLLSLNLLQRYVDEMADPEIKNEWDRHIEVMRRSLDRPEQR